MKKLLMILCTLIIVSACARSMQMPVQECAHIGPTEGIVVGSVVMKGGKDILGRTSWTLHVKGMDPGLKSFSIDVERDGDEAIFVTKMLAGKYHFYLLKQYGFSRFEAHIDVPFTVYPEKTVYIGRLVIEFPEGYIRVFKEFSIRVEDAKDQTLASAEKTHGDLASDAVAHLMDYMSFQEAGIERGQTVFNRVSLRTAKENTIYYANRSYGGILIPAGTECTINDVRASAIKFTANGDEYVLRQWLIAQSTEDAKASFEKFFVEDKGTIGLDKITTKVQKNISLGNAEVGMTKQEVLLSIGYPSYLGRRHRTRKETRERILAHSDWYYLKTGRRKIILRFKGEELAEIIGK